MADVKTLTFADGHLLALARIDEAWRRVLACHLDIDHTKEDSREYAEAKQRLAAAEKAMWRFKDTWHALML